MTFSLNTVRLKSASSNWVLSKSGSPENVAPPYIRLGGTPGDELVGWWRLEDILLERVLGTPTADGKGWTAE